MRQQTRNSSNLCLKHSLRFLNRRISRSLSAKIVTLYSLDSQTIFKIIIILREEIMICIFKKECSYNDQLQYQIKMNCWKILIGLLLLIDLFKAIKIQNKQTYRILNNQTTSVSVKISQKIRYTLIQYQGSIELRIATEKGDTVANHQENFYQDVIPEQFIGETLVFIIVGKRGISAGFIDINPAEGHQIVNFHEEKFIHLRKGEIRIIQITPKNKAKLNVERFDGVPLFINNLCNTYQKKQCLDQMHRFTPSQMKKHIETVDLQNCSNCVLMVKITTKSANTRFRLSIQANRTNVQTYPSLLLLKKDQIQHILIYGQYNNTGKVIVYGGTANLSSNSINFTNFTNGYSYIIQQGQGDNKNIVTIKGISAVSYLMIESPSSSTDITLIDGLPNTFLIEPNTTYHIKYENYNEGKSNIVLSSDSTFLQRLSIKFMDSKTHDHYLIRPKFIFQSSIASQNFQLKKIEQSILIEVHLVSGEAGYLNVTSQVNQYVSLALDFPYTSVLEYQQHDDYIIEGLSGDIDIEIKKCVDCTINYQISQNLINRNPVQMLTRNSIVQTTRVKKGNLFVRVQTNNFAYYSIKIKKHKKINLNQAILPHEQILFYLNQDVEDNLLLQFHPPQCNKSQCSNPKYYLLEGSDYKHLTSKLYCYSSLFNFDERTKDITIEEITPSISNEMMSYSRPLKLRDYIGIVVEVNHTILSYKVINTEEIKLYKSMKWPFFYLAIFVTAALFCSFLMFMVLRRRGQSDSSGYIRVSKISSLQSIS